MPVASMKGGPRRIRLSPNEEARVLREERERRRKARLQQVRDQAKSNASKIRDAVKEEKAHRVSLLAAELKNDWELEKIEKLRKLNEHHLNSLQHVGDAHVNATEQVPREIEDALIAQDNLQKAAQRHLEAIRQMKEKKEEEEAEANRHIITRKFALSQEKERAAIVAALPSRSPDPIAEMELPKFRPIKMTDVNAFSLTHYHLPSDNFAVERAQSPEITDAKAAAKLEQERIDHLEEDERIAAHGRFEKAQLRHKHARRKEVLKQDYDAMLLDLSDMRRSDIARRQQVVAKIPRSVYQAPQRRQEEKEDEQKQMEAKFEDMYMAATDHQGNLTLALDLHPPASDASTTLNHSLASNVNGKVQSLPLKDLTNLSVQTLQSMTKSNESGLSRLMDRIQKQRETWVDKTAPAVAEPGSRQARYPLLPDSESSISTEPSGTLTQHTITSYDTKSSLSKASTLDDASSVSTSTMSKISSGKSSVSSLGTVSAVTSSDVTTTTLDTIEESTLTTSGSELPDASDTLLHPMEIAARVRQKNMSDSQKSTSSYVDHLFPLHSNKVTERAKQQPQQVVEDFRLEQQKLEQERQEIEKKIKELERQAAIRPQASFTDILRPEALRNGMEHDLSAQVLTLNNLPDINYGELLQSFLDKPAHDPFKPDDKITTITQDLKTMADSHRLLVPEPVDKLQQYKQRALDRYREKQKQTQMNASDSTEASMPKDDVLPDSLGRSLGGLGQFEDVSSFTKSASSPSQVFSPSYSLSPAAKATPPSLSQAPQVNPQADITGSEYDSQGQLFDTRQAQLKAQLAEIQRQKTEILENQKHHHDEMVELKKRWQRELQQYSLTDSLISESVNLSMARTKAEIDVELSRSQHSDKSVSDEESLGDLREVSQAIDHKYKVDRKTNKAKVITLPNKSPHVVHDLSTIQEMDTPHTEKKKPTGFASRPLNSTELSQVPVKLPEKPAVRALFVDMYNTKPVPSPQRTEPELSYRDPLPSSHRADPMYGSEHPIDPSWNVASWMDYHDKTDYTPSVDRVQQIERLPSTTPGELVLTDYTKSDDEYKQLQPRSPTFSGLAEEDKHEKTEDNEPVTWSSLLSHSGREADSEKEKPLTYASYLRSDDSNDTRGREHVPLPTGSYLREVESKEPSSPKGPIALGSYIQDLESSGKSSDFKHRSYPVGSYLSDDYSPGSSLKWSGPLPTGSYLTGKDQGNDNDTYKAPPPSGSYLRFENTPEKNKGSPQMPVGSYLKDDSGNRTPGKVDLGPFNVSYLTPPKMTPTRNTDKIVRCITTRAFGCERPTTWRGQKKKATETSPAPVPEVLVPVNRVPEDRNQSVISPEIVKEPPPPPSVIKQMFEKSSHENEPFALLEETSPIPRDRRMPKTAGGGPFLSSTPSSVKAASRLEKTGDGTSIQTPELSTGRLSESQFSSSKLRDETSVVSQYPLSQSERSKNSEFSQYTLDSDSHRSKTPGNVSADSSVLQHRLTTSGFSGSTLSQNTLESSGFPDPKNQSSPVTPFAYDTSQTTPKYPLPLDTSKSSHGSSLSSQGPRPSTEGQAAQSIHGMTGASAYGYSSSGSRKGPSPDVLQLTSHMSQVANAAVLKYDKLKVEAQRTLQQYEAEERALMTETASSASHSSQSNETARYLEKSTEAHISRSLDAIAAEETGISDEPDLTLVSAVSTPQKSPSQSARSTGSREHTTLTVSADSNKTEEPRSLLSFEQHEASLATMSQVSLFHPSASASESKTSTISAVPSIPSDPDQLTPYASTSSNMSRTGRTLASSTGADAPSGKDLKSAGSRAGTGAQSHLTKTLASWKKNNALTSQTAATNSGATAATNLGSVVDTTSEDRKKKEKEMKERTERLYSRLDDVKQKRLEDKRKEDYANNRQRQQEYQKKYQEQFRKKTQSKK